MIPPVWIFYGGWVTVAIHMNHKCKRDQLCLRSVSIDTLVQLGQHCVFFSLQAFRYMFPTNLQPCIIPFTAPHPTPYLAHRCDIHTLNMPTMWKIASDVIFLFLRLRSCIAVEAPCTLMARAQHCSLHVEDAVPNGAPGLIKMYGPGPAQHARLRLLLNLLNNYSVTILS